MAAENMLTRASQFIGGVLLKEAGKNFFFEKKKQETLIN